MELNLFNLSTNALISYVVSWAIFFITLPFFVRVFGSAKGAAINYGISWVTMAAMMYGLHVSSLHIFNLTKTAP